MAKSLCPVGHAVPPAALFCVACGVRVARLAAEGGQLVVRPVEAPRAALAFALVSHGRQLALADDDDVEPRRPLQLEARAGVPGQATIDAGEVILAWQDDREWIEARLDQS